MSDEVTLIQAWIAQGHQTDNGGIPIPPRMEEGAIARVRTRLFGTAPAWTDADRDVLQAVVHRITNTESVPFSDGALRLAVLDIERRMYATQATNPRAANEPTPTGEPTWNDATEALQRHIEQGYAALSPQVQQALVKALDALTSDSRASRKAKR